MRSRLFLALTLLLSAPVVSAQASGAAPGAAVSPEAVPLTRADVRDLVRLRLAEIEVLRDAEAELGLLDNDENGPVARERVEARLAREGWTYEDYQALGNRVADALGAMAMEQEVAGVQAEVEATLAEMAGMMSAEQMSQARAALAARGTEAQAAIDATRPDWPAVKAYFPTLEHLDGYAAGTRADPPTLPSNE